MGLFRILILFEYIDSKKMLNYILILHNNAQKNKMNIKNLAKKNLLANKRSLNNFIF